MPVRLSPADRQTSKWCSTILRPETLSLPEPEIQANVLKAQQETELRKKISSLHQSWPY